MRAAVLGNSSLLNLSALRAMQAAAAEGGLARQSLQSLLHASIDLTKLPKKDAGSIAKQALTFYKQVVNPAQAGDVQSVLGNRVLEGVRPGVVQLSKPLQASNVSGIAWERTWGQRSFSTSSKHWTASSRLGSTFQSGLLKRDLLGASAKVFPGTKAYFRGLATQATLHGAPARPRKGRVVRRLAFLTAFAGVGALVWVVGNGDVEQIERRAKTLYVVPTRLARNIVTVTSIIADYLVSLYGVPEGPARESVKHECHERCADRLQKLFFKNGGIYIKLGQHIGQLDYLLPAEYVRVMQESMLDKCPVSTYEQISAVIQRELGLTPEQAFAEFDPVPLASASLAQVHKARTHQGQEVAVKVQHTHLTDTASADTATVAFFVRAVKRAFPDYDYSWLVAELQESLPRELDFVHEGQNAEACARNFRNQSPHLAPFVKIPEVDWSLSTKKLLTMEFMEGVGVTDIAKQEELGIDRADVAHLVSEVFAAMIFHHGFIHCDPHGGNMLVRAVEQKGTSRRLGKAKPQLVLLDHGLYRSLDKELRSNYAALWKSLVLGEESGIRQYSTAIAGEDMYVLFASVLTMRPWDQVTKQRLDHLVMPDTPEERLQLQGYAAQFMKETTALLARLPRVVLLLLKTNDCLRSVDLALGTPVNSFITTARECTRALSRIRYEENPGIGSLARGAVDRMRIEFRVWAMKVLTLYERVRAGFVSWGSSSGRMHESAVDQMQLEVTVPRGLPA